MSVRSSNRVAFLAALALCGGLLTGPAANAAPAIQQFTATPSGQNTVTIQWQTTGAALLYVRGPKWDEWDSCTPPPCTQYRGKYREDVGWLTTPSGSKSFQVDWGTHTYQLLAADFSGGGATLKATSLSFQPPPDITFNAMYPVSVSYFKSPTLVDELPPHTISWNYNGASYVKMTRPCGRTCADGKDKVMTFEPPETTYEVTGEEMEKLLPESRQGDLTYQFESCVSTSDDLEPMCGGHRKAVALIRVQPSRFTGDLRLFVPAGTSNLEVSWNANGGNLFTIEAPTLLPQPVTTAATSYTFAGTLPNGFHTIRLLSCRNYGGFVFDCAHLPVFTSGDYSGTVSNLVTVGTWCANCRIATVGGTDIFATRAGIVHSTCGCNGQSVGTDAGLAFINTSKDNPATPEILEGGDSDVKQVEVGGRTWTQKSWTGSASDQYRPLTGTNPSKVFDGSMFRRHGVGIGGRWVGTTGFVGGEYGRSMMQLSSSDVLSELEIPLKRVAATESPTPVGGPFAYPVKPFNFPVWTEQGLVAVPVSVSAPQDSKMFDNKWWFTQGTGGMLGGSVPNHSRVFSYDPSGTDNPVTPEDERFCAYNVPGDHNGATGIAYAPNTGRVWIVEHEAGFLTSFNPTDTNFTHCAEQNNFDYSLNPPPFNTPPGYNPGFCSPPPASQVGCWQRVAVPPSAGVPFNITYDSLADTLWMTNYFGVGKLTKYDITTGMFTSYPLPAPSLGHNLLTWDLEASGDYVYVADGSDGEITVFNKTTSTFSEIHVPGRGVGGIRIANGRVYFGTNGIRPDEFNPGYIPINPPTWGPGVLYTGAPGGFSDFDSGGKVLGGTYVTSKIIKLIPNP